MPGLSAGGFLDLLSMIDVANTAFYAIHIRHLRRLITVGVSGPFLCPASSYNVSSGLFSEPFYDAQQNNYSERSSLSNE